MNTSRLSMPISETRKRFAIPVRAVHIDGFICLSRHFIGRYSAPGSI